MFIAKVIGNVVSTQKNAKFRGMKLLLIQPYVSRESGLEVSGSSARLTPATKDAPVDAVIVGIVDTVEVGGKALEKP